MIQCTGVYIAILYWEFCHSKEKFEGNVQLEMIYKKVEFNVEVDESIFVMPKD